MNQNYILALVGLGSAGIGFVAGYQLAKKQITEQTDEQMVYELGKAREYYRKMYKKDEYSDPQAVLEQKKHQEEYREKMDQLDYNTETPEVVEDDAEADPLAEAKAQLEEAMHKHVRFTEQEYAPSDEDDEDDDCESPSLKNPFVYEDEIKDRSPDRPYIITTDEFMEHEGDFDEYSFTYFEGDDVLVDSRDEPIPNPDRIVGEDNLLRFGHGSDEEHMLYVRNEKMEMDIEIKRSMGKFSEEVLGFTHTERRPRNRKPRGDDE